MSKKRFFVVFVVLVGLLLSATPAFAQVPDAEDVADCLFDCYASNIPLDGKPRTGNGSYEKPWVVPEDDVDLLLDAMLEGVEMYGDPDVPSILRITFCERANCTWDEWTFAVDENDGELRATRTVTEKPGVAPRVGVDLPFLFILVGGLVLGVILVLTGVALRRQARLTAA